MMKNLLFLGALFMAGFASAQTFDLMNKNDVSIDGSNYSVIDAAFPLSETKWHVENLTSNTASYTAKVYMISNTPGSDLQICYGANCYTANGSQSGAQQPAANASVAGMTIDTSFKVAPFTFSWNPGDSAVWRVTIHNVNDPTDSASAVITWKYTPASVNEIDESNVVFNVFPNPTSNILSVNFDMPQTNETPYIEVYDVVGKYTKAYTLSGRNVTKNLDVSDLNAGVYFFTIKAGNQALKTERVIIR